MLDRHVHELLSRLKSTDLVLDVGGWACPFNRAQWILDGQPYETRGFYRTFGGTPSQGPAEEWFSRDTWVVRDLCDRAPWPFADKKFDFVVCSQTLEDLRDPLGVCAELMRVGKAGYIEVPSRLFESCLNVERPGQAGLSHHRWLIEIAGQHIKFFPKYHMIHSDRRFSLPARYQKNLTPENSNVWLWWNDRFTFEEIQIHGLEEQEAELSSFVDRVAPPSALSRGMDSTWREMRRLSGRTMRRIERSLRSGNI